MPRSKTYATGGKRRCGECTICGRMFSGDAKLVNKLMNLHTEKNHPNANTIYYQGQDHNNINNWGNKLDSKTPVSLNKNDIKQLTPLLN
jgi:hypothetical protein